MKATKLKSQVQIAHDYNSNNYKFFGKNDKLKNEFLECLIDYEK